MELCFLCGALLFISENEKRRQKTRKTAENAEHAEVAYKVGYEGLARLGLPLESYTRVGDEVKKEVVNNKYNYCRNNKYKRKLEQFFLHSILPAARISGSFFLSKADVVGRVFLGLKVFDIDI